MSDLVPCSGGLPDEKYARELLRRLPKGYKIAFAVRPGDDSDSRAARRMGSHPYVFDKGGAIVRDAEGAPVCVAGTPGSRRSLTRDLAKLKRAGVMVR